LENYTEQLDILPFCGDTTEPLWGADYYQNMMLWALPAAIAGTDPAGPRQPSGLVARMIEAAKGVDRLRCKVWQSS